MIVLLLFLLVGVLAYLGWRWRTTSLTRDCRWRENRDLGIWRCAFCGAETVSRGAPRACLRDRS